MFRMFCRKSTISRSYSCTRKNATHHISLTIMAKRWRTILHCWQNKRRKIEFAQCAQWAENCAITDSTPGTTADTVTTIMEIHGLGPVKILDTAGVDEDSALGKKKKNVWSFGRSRILCWWWSIPNVLNRRNQSRTKLIHHAKEQGKTKPFLFGISSIPIMRNFDMLRKKSDVLGIWIEQMIFRTTSVLRPFFKNTLMHQIVTSTYSLNFWKGMVFHHSYGWRNAIAPFTETTRWQNDSFSPIIRPVLFRLHLGKARSSKFASVEIEKETFFRSFSNFYKIPRKGFNSLLPIVRHLKYCGNGFLRRSTHFVFSHDSTLHGVWRNGFSAQKCRSHGSFERWRYHFGCGIVQS